MLKGQVKPIAAYSEAEIREMYRLMAEFYDHTDEQVFRKDFFDKDYCLALYADSSVPVGFTTQKVLTLQVGGKNRTRRVFGRYDHRPEILGRYRTFSRLGKLLVFVCGKI